MNGCVEVGGGRWRGVPVGVEQSVALALPSPAQIYNLVHKHPPLTFTHQNTIEPPLSRCGGNVLLIKLLVLGYNGGSE